MTVFGVTPSSSGPLARKLAARAKAEAIIARTISVAPEPEPAPPPEPEKPSRKWKRVVLATDRDYLMVATPRRASIADIIAATSRRTGIGPADIKGQGKTAKVVYARQLAIWLARAMIPSASLPVIGRALGGRDHTTILHAVRKIDAMAATDPNVVADQDAVRAMLVGKAWP